MAVRKFKAGDRVQQKSGGPVMEVIKYAMDHLPLGGETYSDHHVVCAWYDENKEHHEQVFDQRALFEVDTHPGGHHGS